MELVGHCAVAALSGVFSEDEVFGSGVVDLMIPNMLHCHDWGYEFLWDLDRFPADLQQTVRLIQAHVIGDWIIHYGSEQTHSKRKRGWAYQHMGFAHNSAVPFFKEAARLGLLAPIAKQPSEWSKKMALDFAHSVTEYALDLVLAPNLITEERFQTIKANLAKVSEDDAPKGRRWLRKTFARLGATTDQAEDIIGRSVEEIAFDARRASNIGDFAIGTTMRKYGFVDSEDSSAYVRRLLEEIADRLPASEIHVLCERIGSAIAQPSSIFTGPWKDLNVTER